MKLNTYLASFAEDTTFHGYRNIFLGHRNICRRLLWIVIILIFTGLMVNQLIQRIQLYRQWPTTVDYRIYSNRTMIFPAVTFCNLNTFKLTTAEGQRYMSAIDSLTGGTLKISRRSVHYIPQRDKKGVNIEDLIIKTAHDKKDLIVKCKWLNQPCSHRNFTPILTRSGLCYMFNGDVTREPLVTRSPGTGLELVLNSETYEYMVGENAGAGIRLLIHDKNVYPSVYELGHEIATDTDTRIDIKFTDVKNMETPYGDCQHIGLKYLNNTYTVAACEMECMSDNAFVRCGCKDAFMPGPHPVCNVSNIQCIRNMINSSTEQDMHCICPPPCMESRYESVLSYASLSDFAVQRMQSSLNEIDLENTLLKSMLVYRQSIRRDEDLFSLDFMQLRLIKGMFNDIVLTLLNMTSGRTIADMRHFKQICAVENNKDWINRAENFSVLLQNFVVSPFVFYFSNLASMFTIYWNMELIMNRIPNADISGSGVSFLVDITDELIERLQYISSNYSMVTQDFDVVTFLPDSIVSNTTRRIKSLEIKLDRFKYVVENLDRYDADLVKEIDHDAFDLLRHIYKTRDIFRSRILTARTPTLKNECAGISRNGKNILRLISHFRDDTATQLSYSHDILAKLYQLHMTDNTTSEDFRAIDLFLEQAKDEAMFYRLYSSNDYWNNRLNTSVLQFYQAGDDVFSLSGKSTPASGRNIQTMQSYLIKIKNQLNIITRTFEHIYHKWVVQLQTERDRTKIDAAFYRKNFIHLRLAYHEMSYRKIVQSDSYGVIALLSDIGGSMGLFIGGSVISVIELIEFVLVAVFFANVKHDGKMAKETTTVNSGNPEEVCQELHSL